MREGAPNPTDQMTFDTELSNAYRDAIGAGVDMQQATKALERMRAAVTTSDDPYAIADVLNGIVNKSVGSHSLGAILIRLRRTPGQPSRSRERSSISAHN